MLGRTPTRCPCSKLLPKLWPKASESIRSGVGAFKHLDISHVLGGTRLQVPGRPKHIVGKSAVLRRRFIILSPASVATSSRSRVPEPQRVISAFLGSTSTWLSLHRQNRRSLPRSKWESCLHRAPVRLEYVCKHARKRPRSLEWQLKVRA